jgi:hypothetical protein
MFQKLFYGRNGIDMFSAFLLVLSVLFFGLPHFLWVIGILLIAYALFRAFSRNVEKRRRELYAFNGVMQKISYFFMNISKRLWPFFTRIKKRFATSNMRWKQRKEYVFIKCKKCKKLLRLPRGKGKIVVTCPVCHNECTIKT